LRSVSWAQREVNVSLVEKAIQKMQASERLRKQTVEQPPTPIAQVINTPARPLHRSSAVGLPAFNPNRLIKVDHEALKASGLLPPADQERELMDQYRAIKRPLIRAAFHADRKPGPSPQVIMIGSALPGDGKTFTGINLAFSMAREKDYSVLLVDADVIKPHVSTLFGVAKEKGLLDALVDPNLDVRSLILPTDIPGLALLPAGTPADNATELLASTRMREIVEQLHTMDPSRLVVMDTLPILLTSESRVLTQLVGQIVLVVKAGVTPQHAVTDALAAIGEDKDVSLVLNQAELTGPMGYYYGYRYGYKQKNESPLDSAGRAATEV
jgi:protein-tyrosine kinase